MNTLEKSNPVSSLISKETGLLIFGAGAGVLLAGAVGKHARKPLSIILGAAGIAAAGPELKRIADKLINNPSSPRGSRKTLENIRFSAGKPVENVEYIEQHSDENLFIG